MQNNTFFGDLLSRHTIVLHETTSTNDYLLHLLTNSTPLPEYTAIMAKTQTKGRGQRGTTWHATPFSNLTCSIYLRPEGLPIGEQFFLTVIASLAIRDTVLQYIDQPVHIKWPNDIYVGRRKLGGILIENKLAGSNIRASVIGIGLNILETAFPTDLQAQAVSFRQLSPHQDFSFLAIIQHIQRFMMHYHHMLKQGQHELLLQKYNAHLFQRHETRQYLVDGEVISGKILGVERDGLLQIAHSETIKKYDLKGLIYQL